MLENLEKPIEVYKRFRNFIKPIMANKSKAADNDITLIISDPLTLAMNCCWRQGISPHNTQTTSVVPLDKKSRNMTF